jgi:serine/threonine protein phosphatase PrpC
VDPTSFLIPALKQSFERVDEDVSNLCRRRETNGGSTAVVACICRTRLVIAHCGDTRAVLLRNGTALELTEDHKPNLKAEKARIKANGGRVVMSNGVPRINGKLAVARAFGDVDLKVCEECCSGCCLGYMLSLNDVSLLLCQ